MKTIVASRRGTKGRNHDSAIRVTGVLPDGITFNNVDTLSGTPTELSANVIVTGESAGFCRNKTATAADLPASPLILKIFEQHARWVSDSEDLPDGSTNTRRTRRPS